MEAIISHAFEFLKQKQNPDGSWGTADQVGTTALALLAYLGRCETPESPFYGETILKALLFLIQKGRKNADGILASDIASAHAAAEHGLATHALGEMYLAARYGSKSLPGLREAFEKDLKVIINQQRPTGGWGGQAGKAGYSVAGSGSPFVTVWQCEALATAKRSGLKIEGLSNSIDKATAFILTLQQAEGGFSSETTESPAAITGACLRVLQILHSNHTEKMARGYDHSRKHYKNEPFNWGRADLFSCLFDTLAFHQAGGDYWRSWNFQLLPEVFANCKPKSVNGKDDRLP